MTYDSVVIGKNIEKERKRMKITQKDLGKLTGVCNKQISLYESGKLTPPIDMLFKMCDVFDCELGYLLGEETYAQRTKVETKIVNELGLSLDAICVIKKVTGTDKHCLSFGYNSKEYQEIINSLLLSDSFIPLIEELCNLNSLFYSYNNVFGNLINEYGQEAFDNAMELYIGEVDYKNNKKEIKKIDESSLQMLENIDKAIEAQYIFKEKIYLSRYLLNKHFESLVDEKYLCK